jgi:hypothetical protein
MRVKLLFENPLTIFLGGIPLLLSGPFLILAIVLSSAFASDVDYDLIKQWITDRGGHNCD